MRIGPSASAPTGSCALRRDLAVAGRPRALRPAKAGAPTRGAGAADTTTGINRHQPSTANWANARSNGEDCPIAQGLSLQDSTLLVRARQRLQQRGDVFGCPGFPLHYSSGVHALPRSRARQRSSAVKACQRLERLSCSARYRRCNEASSPRVHTRRITPIVGDRRRFAQQP